MALTATDRNAAYALASQLVGATETTMVARWRAAATPVERFGAMVALTLAVAARSSRDDARREGWDTRRGLVARRVRDALGHDSSDTGVGAGLDLIDVEIALDHARC